jgi:hypothetical protein
LGPSGSLSHNNNCFVLAEKLGLLSVQCNITAAFVHGRVPEHKEMHVHQPQGFYKGDKNQVLKLKQTLYGLKQSPRYFFKYFTDSLISQGLTPSNFDPCLFLSSLLIVIIYVNDILIYGQNKNEIKDFIKRMKTEDVALHKEGTTKGYLGVDIKRDRKKTIFTQIGLTKRIIEAFGLNTKYSTAKSMPANTNALGKDLDGPPASGDINNASVIGMFYIWTTVGLIFCLLHISLQDTHLLQISCMQMPSSKLDDI